MQHQLSPPGVLIGPQKHCFGLICSVVGKNWLAYIHFAHITLHQFGPESHSTFFF